MNRILAGATLKKEEFLMKKKAVACLLAMTTMFSMSTGITAMAAVPTAQNDETEVLVQQEGAVVTGVTLENGTYMISTEGSDTPEEYTEGMTFVALTDSGVTLEVDVSEVQDMLDATPAYEVKVYNTYHKTGYGSSWSTDYDYTTYRTGIQLGEDAEIAIGAENMGATLTTTDALYTLSGLDLVSVSKNFNPVVINNPGTDVLIDNPYIQAGSKSNEDLNTNGNADVNDFVGYGTAVTIYGSSVATGASVDADGMSGGTTVTGDTYETTVDLSDGGVIYTYGVARPAVEVDNGGDVIILGDGDDNTTEIAAYGGTLVQGFLNTADTTKMVSPPWVLGIVGNARTTNMLGKGSTMVVQDATAYATGWGVLSTDAGSNPNLYAINSTVNMNTDEEVGDVSGYGSYAIGNAHEYFLGSTFNVATYLTIAANGNDNMVTLGATTEGETINIAKQIWAEDGTDSELEDYTSVVASKTAQTVINSENFGIDIWGQATVNVNDATEMNTKSAAFLVKGADAEINISADAKIAAASDGNAHAEEVINGTSNGVIFQAIDNEDSAATGISFPDGYSGPVFSGAEFDEAEGWQVSTSTTSAHTANVNISDKDMAGNIYNGTGYFADGVEVNVALKSGATLTGAVSSTTIKHSSDGRDQNTSISISDYNQIGHVVNMTQASSGANDVNLTIEDGATWVVDGTANYLASLTIGNNATISYGKAYDAQGNEITLEKGQTYTNVIVTKEGSTFTPEITDTPSEEGTTLAANKVTVKTKKLSIKKGKSKNITATAKGGAKLTFKKVKGNKKIKVSAAGKVTAKAAKGKYTIKVKVTSAKTAEYKKASTTSSIKIVVK